MRSIKSKLTICAGILLTSIAISFISCEKSKVEKKVEPKKKEEVAEVKSADQAASDEPQFAFDLIDCAAAREIITRNGIEAKEFTMVETLGNGVAIFDYDRDGMMDVFFVGGGIIEDRKLIGRDPSLLRNLGQLRLENLSKSTRVEGSDRYSVGVVVGDHDSDGFEDLLITEYGGVEFLRNQGDGTFQKSELPGVNETQWSTGGAWADLDANGHPDLFIAHYVDWSWKNNPPCFSEGVRNLCPPRQFNGVTDTIYMNNGDGTYSVAGPETGLANKGKGLGVIACDPDQDSDIDIYVGNDTDENYYYVNDGTGHFEEIANERGMAVGEDGRPNGSMGLALCDFDNDQAIDIWVTNYENDTFALYRNANNSYFVHASLVTGITRLGVSLVGWGTAWVDFDFDGDEDMLVVNGHANYDNAGNGIPQYSVLMENQNKRMFPVAFEPTTYIGQTHLSRGLAMGDFDNDGDLDAAISNLNEPVALLKNKCERKGNWLCVDLIGRTSPRLPIGASLILHTDRRAYLRQIEAGGSYLSSNDRRVFWGIPDGEKIEKLVVRWPSGIEQVVTDLNVNQFKTLIEPNDP